jgi:hypothetical protein
LRELVLPEKFCGKFPNLYREVAFNAVGVVGSFRAWLTGLDRGKRRQNRYFPAFLRKSARWWLAGPGGVFLNRLVGGF